MKHGIFGTNLKDDKTGFYRIVQPLRFLKRSGWNASMVPFTGENDISVLPVSDEFLVMFSKDKDFLLTHIIKDEDELLRMLNLRKHNNAKWIVDVNENFFNRKDYEPYISNILKSISLADGVIVPNERLKELVVSLNDNVYILPSAIDFEFWGLKTHVARGKIIGIKSSLSNFEKINPTLGALTEQGYKFKIANLNIDGIVDLPQKITKAGLHVAVFPLEDSGYTRYKENIDILEMMALKVPVIASPIEPFKGLPILYARNNYEWFQSLEKILTDRKFRDDMVETAYKYVHEHYDMKKFVSGFQKWLKELPRKKY